MKNDISKNLEILNKFDFQRILNEISVKTIKGEMVSYLSMMVDKSSKEILTLSEEVQIVENAITTPVALKRKKLGQDFRLELVVLEGEEMPVDVKEAIEESFVLFNQSKNQNP
jgi:hypothetical protein